MELSMKPASQNLRHIQNAKAICDLRDRLWKFTSASFRHCRVRRSHEELLKHLYDAEATIPKKPHEAEAA